MAFLRAAFSAGEKGRRWYGKCKGRAFPNDWLTILGEAAECSASTSVTAKHDVVADEIAEGSPGKYVRSEVGLQGDARKTD